MPEQVDIIKSSKYGATMRLGACPADLVKFTKVWELYGKLDKISERHRHRYEVNPEYVKKLEQKGLIFSGWAPGGKLADFVELKDHIYFVATQAHPEFKSRPMKPAPLFDGLIKAALKRSSKS